MIQDLGCVCDVCIKQQNFIKTKVKNTEKKLNILYCLLRNLKKLKGN